MTAYALQDKIAVVTGGGAGIGAASARRLAEGGAVVVVFGRNAKPLEETAAAIEAAGGKARHQCVDVGEEADFRRALKEVHEREKGLHILINNAYAYAGGMIGDTSYEDWRACFRVSLDAAFTGVSAAMPLIAASGGGAIVNVSSLMATLSMPGMATYSAAKAGLLALGRGAAVDGGAQNVRVNTVIPGVVDTPGTAAMVRDDATRQAIEAATPLRRIADADEIANVIAFLASDDAAYVTGAAWTVDGGRTCVMNTGGA